MEVVDPDFNAADRLHIVSLGEATQFCKDRSPPLRPDYFRKMLRGEHDEHRGWMLRATVSNRWLRHTGSEQDVLFGSAPPPPPPSPAPPPLPSSTPLFRPCHCRRLYLPPTCWITLPGWQWLLAFRRRYRPWSSLGLLLPTVHWMSRFCQLRGLCHFVASFRHVAVDYHGFLISAAVDTDYVRGLAFGCRELGPRSISAIFESVILAGSSLSP